MDCWAFEAEVVTGARGLCSYVVFAAHGVFELEVALRDRDVEVVTGSRGLCSLLVSAARGFFVVVVVTGARCQRDSRGRGR